MKHSQKTTSRLWLVELGLAFVPLYFGVFRVWRFDLADAADRGAGVILCFLAFAIVVDALRRAFLGVEWIVEWDNDTLRIVADGMVVLRSRWADLRVDREVRQSVLFRIGGAPRPVAVPLAVVPLELEAKIMGLPNVLKDPVLPIDRRPSA